MEGSLIEHAKIIQQLNQKRMDKTFKSEVRLCDLEDNTLATYLAKYGEAG